jgi:hypothetical protein
LRQQLAACACEFPSIEAGTVELGPAHLNTSAIICPRSKNSCADTGRRCTQNTQITAELNERSGLCSIRLRVVSFLQRPTRTLLTSEGCRFICVFRACPGEGRGASPSCICAKILSWPATPQGWEGRQCSADWCALARTLRKMQSHSTNIRWKWPGHARP